MKHWLYDILELVGLMLFLFALLTLMANITEGLV